VRDLLLLVLLSLSAYRLTRLAVRDTFPPVLWLRDRLAGGWRETTEPEDTHIQNYLLSVDRADDRGTFLVPNFGHVMIADDGTRKRYRRRVSWSPYWLAELITCPWCAGGWLSGALVLAAWLTIGVPYPLLAWPAVWAVGSWLASREWA
jgi:uncharacterized protein DUF1360